MEIIPLPAAPEKKTRTVRPRIEVVVPSSIVEVWRLVEHSLRDGGQSYPDTTEDSPELIRAHLFAYLQNPTFAGLMVRVGKKPVAVCLGNIQTRAYGRPSRFAFIWGFWVEPSYRKQGIGQLLFKEYADRVKKAGIFHFETHAHDHLVKQLVRDTGVPMARLLTIIGGRL